MIPALYRLPAPDGALLLLARLYDDVEDQGSIAAWEEGASEHPPFCWRLAVNCYETLQQALDRGRTAVTSHLAALTKIGVIRRAKRDGRSGWELLGTRPPPPATSGDPDVDVRPAGRPCPKTLTKTSAPPDVCPPPKVRPAGPPGPPPRTSTSGSPDVPCAREDVIKQEPDLARRGEAANGRPAQASTTATSSRPTPAAPAWRTTPPPVREPERPRPAPPQGPTRALLLDLARELDGMFTPRDVAGVVLESRRIRPDADTLRRLAELLTPPEDVDVAAWLERQVATVRAYVRDYATICEADPEQARQWGGDMLEPRIRKGVRSAWETLTRIVDRWREAQAAAAVAVRDAAAEARRAEARAVAERLAELEQLVRHGEPAFARELRAAGQVAPPLRDHAADHAAAAAAVAAALAAGREPTLAEVTAAVAVVPARGERPATTPLPPLPPMQHVGEPPVRELSEGDEAEIRERGRQREARASTGVDEQRARQRINEVFREFRERVGRSPTPEEADEIRRQVRGVEGATGT